MPTSEDIKRLRSSTSDDVLYQHFYQQDAGFKTAVDRVKGANPQMGVLEEAKMPTAMLNLYYDIPDETPVNPMTTQMASALGESTVMPEAQSPDGSILDPNPVEDASLGGFAGNVLKSGGRMIEGIGSALMHPFRTAGTLSKLVVGGAANAVESVASLLGSENPEDLIHLQSEELASQVGEFYKNRYKSPDAIAKTLYEDPIGFLSDLATVVAGVGGVVRVAGKAGTFGTAMATAGKDAVALDSAAAIAGRTATKVADIGGDMVRAGAAIDPVIATGRVAGKVAKGVLSRFTPEKLVSSSLKLNPSDIRTIVKPNVAGTTPENWLLKNGIISKTGDTADTLMDKLDDFASQSAATRDTGLSGIATKFKISDKVDMEALAQKYGSMDDIPLDQIDNVEAARVAGIATMPRVGEALDELQKLFEGTVGNEEVLATVKSLKDKGVLTLPEINKVKQLMDKYISVYTNSGDVKAGAAAIGLKNVRSQIQKFIEDEATKAGFKDVRRLNKNVQVANEIRDAIQKTALRQSSNRLISLTDLMVGSAGSMGLGIPGGLAIIAGKKALESQRFKTAVASILHGLSPEQIQMLEKGLTGANKTTEAISLAKEVLTNAAVIESTLRANEVDE